MTSFNQTVLLSDWMMGKVQLMVGWLWSCCDVQEIDTDQANGGVIVGIQLCYVVEVEVSECT